MAQQENHESERKIERPDKEEGEPIIPISQQGQVEGHLRLIHDCEGSEWCKHAHNPLWLLSTDPKQKESEHELHRYTNPSPIPRYEQSHSQLLDDDARQQKTRHDEEVQRDDGDQTTITVQT